MEAEVQPTEADQEDDNRRGSEYRFRTLWIQLAEHVRSEAIKGHARGRVPARE